MAIDLFLLAGEKSGDLLGGQLLSALYESAPKLQVHGIGGPCMRLTPFQCFIEMEELQVMGFIDVLWALPRLKRLFYATLKEIERLQPKVVVTIDYPGFNLRLAKTLRKRGFQGKLIHYVCPSVWAWGKKRIPLMESVLDCLLCILPFEPPLFSHLRALFVGNPLAERVRSHTYQTFTYEKPLIALFPGSRKKEIERNLPHMLEACARHKDMQVALSVSDAQLRPVILQVLQKEGWEPEECLWVGAEHTYALMRAAHLAIAKSGTVTLELALHRTPTVVIYAVSWLDQCIARYILRIRLPFYCLVNIVAKKRVFAELIGPHLTPKGLNAEVEHVLQQENREEIQRSCDALIEQLGKGSPSERAAQEILTFMGRGG